MHAAIIADDLAGAAELVSALEATGRDRETAVGVARRLGVAGIRLEGEAEPGVPVGSLIGPRTYRVVAKAGAFGEPDTLLRAVHTLLKGGKD